MDMGNEARKPVDWDWVRKEAQEILDQGLDPDKVEYYQLAEGTHSYRNEKGEWVTESTLGFVSSSRPDGSL